jgi:hypothetical protein
MAANKSDRWIQRAIKHPGAFRAEAKRAGMSTKEYARKVLANPKAYSERTVRRARLATTLAKMRRNKRR